MNDHQPKTFMGIDLAASGADQTVLSICDELSRPDGIIAVPEGEDPAAYLEEMRRICRDSRPKMIFSANVADLGVNVEEAPEAPQDSPARRVTAELIEAKITQEDYIEGINGRLTVCVLTLANGFLVTGESACVDSCNYDAALGRKIARANAFEKLWPLEGYLLRDQIEAARDVTEPATDTGRAADEGWDDPEAVADAGFHAHALIGTQSASATFTDGAWLRQRAFELAQVENTHLDVKDLIESARLIEAYIAGQPEPEPAPEAAPATDAELIQRAHDVLVDAVKRGEAPTCDHAADAIHAMADWLNEAASK